MGEVAASPTHWHYNIYGGKNTMNAKFVTDIITVGCFLAALSLIDFDKEAVKALITGGVITWWVMRRVR